uniref:Uncharacterized protein n=1 Tax=Moniliophthora roreri TaxID=221103 RepID=A0A0W0FYU0_MONRR
MAKLVEQRDSYV